MQRDKPPRHGPNVVLTGEDIQMRNKALREITDSKIVRCKQYLLDGDKSLAVLVVGESAVPEKSTLIKTLLGKEPTHPDMYLDLGRGRGYKNQIGKVNITVLDVPDLCEDEIRQYRRRMREYCPNGVDVVYVCYNYMNSPVPAAIATLRRFSNVFGEKILEKAMVLMSPYNHQSGFKREWIEQATTIRDELCVETGITLEEAEKLLVFPAGIHESRHIFNVTGDWIMDVIVASINCCPSAAPAILHVMASQVHEMVAGGGKLIGYVFEFLDAIGLCLQGIDEGVYEKIRNLLENVASNIFYAERGISENVGSVFKELYIYASARDAATRSAVGSAVSSMLMGAMGVIVVGLAAVVIAVTFAVAVGISLGVIGGSAGGTVVGAIVGAIVGSFFGTPAGAGTGAQIGAVVGAIVGGGGGAAAVAGYMFNNQQPRFCPFKL